MNETTTPNPLVLEEDKRWLGVYDDLPDAKYRRAPGINKSGLDILQQRSPLHFITEKYNPRPPTPAMLQGSAFHCLVLEPDEFSKRYVKDEFPGSYSKQAKVWRAEQQVNGLSVIPASENPDAGIWGRSVWDAIHYMRDAVLAHPLASIFLQGKVERSLFWVDQTTKKLCKARIDTHNTDHDIIVDLKSSADASYSGFARSIHDYRYFVQDAFYSDGAWDCKLGPKNGFMFVVVEKEPPYAVAIYMIDKTWQQVGREVYLRGLELFKKCHDAKDWPGFPLEPRAQAMPGYAKFHKIA